jgi:hypothetical protein
MPRVRPGFRLLLLAGALLVGCVVAREAGLVDLELQAHSSTKTSTKTLQGADALHGPDVHIVYVDGEQRDVHYINSGGKEPLDVTVQVVRYELSGWTWTPLYKRAKVEYEIEITTPDPGIGGSVSGTIETTSRGLISHRAFCQALRESVRAEARAAMAP